VTSLESSGLNAGYGGQLLEQYLENPEAVDPAWRALFEAGDVDVLSALPGLERLVEGRTAQAGNGSPAAADGAVAVQEPVAGELIPVAPAPVTSPPAPEATADGELVAAVAAAMSLVKAYRTHGHLNARLDPLGS